MSDRNLIEGQYRMRMAEYELDKAEYMGPMSVFEAFKTWNGIGKSLKGKDYSEPMEKITDNGSALSQKDYNQIAEKLGGENQDMYLNADDATQQQQALENVKKWNGEMVKYDDMVTGFARDMQDGNISEAIKHDPAGIALMEYFKIDNPKKLWEGPCPDDEPDCEKDFGIMFPNFESREFNENRLNELNQEIINLELAIDSGTNTDEAAYIDLENLRKKQLVYQQAVDSPIDDWKSLQWVRQSIDSWKKDQSTPKVIQTYADQAFNFGLTNNPDDNIPFEEDKFRQLLDDNIFGGETPGNIRSMIYDPMIGSRIFKEDFTNILKGNIGDGTPNKHNGLKYSDLGITDEMLEGYDANTNNIIDDDEVQLIVDTLLKDNDQAVPYLKEYFMFHFKNNHDNGKKKNRPPVLDDEGNVLRDENKSATRYVRDSL